MPFGPAISLSSLFSKKSLHLTVLVAIFYAFYRRYIEKLVRLKRGLKNGLVIIFITGIMITVLLGNGMSMIWHGHEATWAEPVASSISFLFGWIGETAAIAVFYIAWWLHLLIILTFLVYIPQSKHFHLIAGPLNVYLNRLDRPGKLKTINFEEEPEDEEAEVYYGAKRLKILHSFSLWIYMLV